MTAKFNFKERFSKQRLTHNIGLKILSLVVAIFLWLIVVNLTDPVVTKTYRNVPVKLLNEGVITENGKTVEVIDDSAVISTVTIKASRTTIQEFGDTIDYIYATADLKELSQDGTSVPITVTTTKYSDKIESIRTSSDTVYVSIENRKTIQLPIQATTSGDIESGYIIGSVTPNQNQVRVSGPESVIDTITSAGVDVQVTGFTSDISTQAEVLLYNDDGDEVDQSDLELNVDSVRVDVELLLTKKVPVYYSVSGVAAEGYEATGEVTLSPETVIIAGSTATIDDVDSVSIPSSELNITGQSGNMYAVVNIKDYLPEDTRLADSSSNGNINVTIYIEKTIDKDYQETIKNISIENIPDGFEAEFADENDDISFTLTGLKQNLEKLKVSDLNLRVDFDDYSLLNDVTDFSEGAYKCYLVMDLPEGVECGDTIPITVNLIKK